MSLIITPLIFMGYISLASNSNYGFLWLGVALLLCLFDGKIDELKNLKK